MSMPASTKLMFRSSKNDIDIDSGMLRQEGRQMRCDVQAPESHGYLNAQAAR
jgi:hypothetical protein